MKLIKSLIKTKTMYEENSDEVGREKKCNILLVSDRLKKYIDIIGLRRTIDKKENLYVLDFVEDWISAAAVAQKCDIDIIVFCGYQRNKNHYMLPKYIEKLDKGGKKLITVLWGIINNVIIREQKSFQINYIFERLRQTEEFADFLDEIKDKDIPACVGQTPAIGKEKDNLSIPDDLNFNEHIIRVALAIMPLLDDEDFVNQIQDKADRLSREGKVIIANMINHFREQTELIMLMNELLESYECVSKTTKIELSKEKRATIEEFLKADSI